MTRTLRFAVSRSFLSTRAGVRNMFAREGAVDELLMDGMAKLNNEIVDTLDEPRIAQQLTEQLVVLLDPMRFDEGDDRRAQEEGYRSLQRADGLRRTVRSSVIRSIR